MPAADIVVYVHRTSGGMFVPLFYGDPTAAENADWQLLPIMHLGERSPWRRGQRTVQRAIKQGYLPTQ